MVYKLVPILVALLAVATAFAHTSSKNVASQYDEAHIAEQLRLLDEVEIHNGDSLDIQSIAELSPLPTVFATPQASPDFPSVSPSPEFEPYPPGCPEGYRERTDADGNAFCRLRGDRIEYTADYEAGVCRPGWRLTTNGRKCRKGMRRRRPRCDEDGFVFLDNNCYGCYDPTFKFIENKMSCRQLNRIDPICDFDDVLMDDGLCYPNEDET